MSIVIKEILKTDSLAATRITLNSNMDNLKKAIEKLEKNFNSENVFDVKLIKSKIVDTNTIKIGKDFSVNTDWGVCLKIDEDGNIWILDDYRKLTINLNAIIRQSIDSTIEPYIDTIVKYLEDVLIHNGYFIEVVGKEIAENKYFIELISKYTIDAVIKEIYEKVVDWVLSSDDFMIVLRKEVMVQVDKATEDISENIIKIVTEKLESYIDKKCKECLSIIDKRVEELKKFMISEEYFKMLAENATFVKTLIESKTFMPYFVKIAGSNHEFISMIKSIVK